MGPERSARLTRTPTRRPIAGWPEMTLRRGKIVVENGTLSSEPSEGTWLPRKIDSSVLAGPT